MGSPERRWQRYDAAGQTFEVYAPPSSPGTPAEVEPPGVEVEAPPSKALVPLPMRPPSVIPLSPLAAPRLTPRGPVARLPWLSWLAGAAAWLFLRALLPQTHAGGQIWIGLGVVALLVAIVSGVVSSRRRAAPAVPRPVTRSRYQAHAWTIADDKLTYRWRKTQARSISKPADGIVVMGEDGSLTTSVSTARLPVGDVSQAVLQDALQRHGWTLVSR